MKQNKTFFHIIVCILLCAVFSACFGTPKPARPPVSVQVPVETAVPTDDLDGAIREASTYLNGRIPKGSKIVFLNIRSDYPDLSEYILSILSENAVNDGVFSVVDRQQLDMLRAELDFQMSGEVSDESAQSIGKMLGAEGIVSGTINKIGPLYRVQVKAIEVQTAGVQGQWSRNIPERGVTLAALTERYAPASVSSSVPRNVAQTESPAAQTATSAPQTPSSSTRIVESPEPEEVIPVPEAPKTYNIGDTGPAGGIVFYDKGNNSGGWQYLEAAPADIGSTQWQSSSTDISGTKDTVGSGMENTQILIRSNVRAAMLCDQYMLREFGDWFLPSKAELDLMYINLKMIRNIGDFSDNYYWSSTQVDRDRAWTQRFNDGSQVGGYSSNNRKDNTHSVRAIRQF